MSPLKTALALAFLLIVLFPSPSQATQHSIYTGFAEPEAAFTLNSRDFSFPSETDTRSLTITAQDDAVYRYGFISYDGQAWKPFELAGNALGGEWLNGSVVGQMTFSPVNFSLDQSRLSTRRNFVVVYSCSRDAGTWNCHDGWQIWQFNATLQEQAASCSSGQTREVSCTPSEPHGTGTQEQECQNGVWADTGSCVLTGCIAGYELQGSSCVLAVEDLLCPTGLLSDGVTPCPPLAFPTAEGFGRFTKGGREGTIIYVTNLDDSGPGSFRDAVLSSGPRIIVFNVSGTIFLESEIKMRNPYITVAGQTAPGDGITIRGNSMYVENSEFIVRHLKIRPGDEPIPDVEGIKSLSISGSSTNARQLYNIIFDHISAAWATDGHFDVWVRASDNGNITIQHCIISEMLRHSISHPEGSSERGHSRALLIDDKVHRLSIHNNLFSQNTMRNPQVATDIHDIDIVNNVVYNWDHSVTHFSVDDYYSINMNIMNNYYKKGVDTGEYALMIRCSTHPDSTIYIGGNYISEGEVHKDPTEENFIIAEEPGRVIDNIILLSAEDAYDNIISTVGNTVPKRDAHDERIINDTIYGTGRIIDSPDEVCIDPPYNMSCGFLDVPVVYGPDDTDLDGMPDSWETFHCLDPDDPSDGPAYAISAIYTNVEVYLNELAGDFGGNLPSQC
jgi:pectate lyase